MKKIPALLLVLLAAALICASCAGREPESNEPAEARIVNYRVYNHTGEIISEMKMTCTGSDGTDTLTVHPGTEGSPDNNYLLNGFSVNAAIQQNVKFSYKNGSGYTLETDLPQDGDINIILLPREDGGIRIEPAAGRE